MKLPYIDALRGIAVCGVMLVHTSHIGYEVSSFSLFWLIQNGALGVQLFYLVSAFTLFLSMTNRRGETRKTSNFFLRRFFRIAPLFYLALGYYLIQDGYGLNPAQWNALEIGGFLSSLFFVHGVHPDWINFLVPGGWSVAVEMMFYVLVPVLFVYANTTSRIIWLLAGSWVISVLSGAGAGMLEGNEREFLILWLPNQMPVFILGILAFHHLYREKQPLKWYLLGAILLLILDLSVSGIRLFPDHLIASCCFFLVLILLASDQVRHIRYRGISYLGKISYSCYLVHFAIIFQLGRVGWDNPLQALTNDPVYNFGARYLLVLLLTVAVAGITYQLIEQPGIQAGKKLIQKLSMRASSHIGHQ